MSAGNGDSEAEALDPDNTGRAASDRELLARVDERSMAMHQGLQQTRSELRGFRHDVRRDFLLLATRLEALEGAVRDVPRIAQASADESGEHAHQEILNLRTELAKKEKSELEARLKDANDKLEANAKAEAERKKESRDRRLLMAIAVLGPPAAALVTHFAHVLGGH